MEYELCIEIFGLGEDPNHRCHWGFVIRKPANPYGDLLNVQIIDSDKLWYHFEYRPNIELNTMGAVGLCKIATLTFQQRLKAMEIIKGERAPMDGEKRCQDWTFDTLISLEVEDLVPAGTSEFWKGIIGKMAKEIRDAVGENWIGF